MKALAGNTKTGTGDKDAYIKNFKRVNVIPNQYKNVNYIISTNTSEYEAYIWYEDGTIYYYTEADKIRLNSDSSYLFSGLSSLTSLDLSNFDSSNVTNMNGMFQDCSKLKTINLSNLDTSKVTNMSYMFWGCKSLERMDLSNFDTSKVTNMFGMFYNDNNLVYLNVSSFNTRNVTTMEAMLNDLHTIRTIYVSDKFVSTKVTNGERMFKNDYYLKGGNGTTYDENRINLNYAYVDTNERIGYFT